MVLAFWRGLQRRTGCQPAGATPLKGRALRARAYARRHTGPSRARVGMIKRRLRTLIVLMQTFGKREIQTLNRNLKLQPKPGKTSKGNKIAQNYTKTALTPPAHSTGIILPRRKPSGHSKIAVLDIFHCLRTKIRLGGGFFPCLCASAVKLQPDTVPKEVAPKNIDPALPPDMSFEAALGELDKIVAAMEAGELPLDESLKAYQRGVALVKTAHARLAAAEQQVKILEDGVLKPLALDEEDE